MAEVKDYRSPQGEKGIEITEWEPGFRERKVGRLRIIWDNNPRKLENEEIRVEIDIPEGRADTTPKEQASFYLPFAALTKGIDKLAKAH